MENLMEESRQFCQQQLYNFRLSERELLELDCVPVKVCGTSLGSPVLPAPAVVSQPLAQELYKKAYTVRSEEGTNSLTFYIDNYVHVTYFVNARSGKACHFSLVALAEFLLPFYAEYWCEKFAKINLRYLNGLSHLLYPRSVLVETGSDNPHTSRRLLRHTVQLLRERCGYPHLAISKRLCQNIVATGRVDFSISLVALRLRFPALVEEQCGEAGKRRRFDGEILRLGKLRKLFPQHDCQFENDYGDEEDDEEEFLASINEGALLPGDPPLPEMTLEAIMEEELLKATEEYDQMARGNGAENGTFLVFQEGQIICTGLKSQRALLEAYTLVFRLLLRCKQQDPNNQSLEKSVREKQPEETHGKKRVKK
jgi:TATA-box binding protein (TBP) (component of TFIID and TFIIIB)